MKEEKELLAFIGIMVVAGGAFMFGVWIIATILETLLT